MLITFPGGKKMLLGYRALRVAPFKTSELTDRFSWNLVWPLCHWACPRAIYFLNSLQLSSKHIYLC